MLSRIRCLYPLQKNLGGSCIYGRYLIVILTLIFWVPVVYPASVVVDGIAALQKNRLGIARDQAIEDALRKAVEQAVGALVSSATMVQNYEVLSDQIYTQTKGYVQQYKILSEGQEENLYRVTIRATVNAGQLQQDLAAIGLLYRRVKQPRVMVIIPETHIGRQPPDPAGETEIIRYLISQGIKVVDQAQSRRIRQGDQLRQLLNGDLQAAARIRQRYGAEILIAGEAFSEHGMSRASLISVRARVEARAVRTDTGEVITADGAFAPGVDIAEHIAAKKALAQAGRKWAEANVPIILERWATETSGTVSLQMLVQGLTLRQLVQFEGSLKSSLRGVQDIQRRSFDHGIAVLDMDVKGNAHSLAEQLVERDLGNFVAEVTGFTAHRIELRVTPRR